MRTYCYAPFHTIQSYSSIFFQINKYDTEFGIRTAATCGTVCEENTTTTTHGTSTGVNIHTGEPLGTGPTPSGEPFPRKRRRRAASFPSSVCCSENLCNHDSPCGKFPCDFDEISVRFYDNK